MAAEPLPVHVGSAEELDVHLIEKIPADGTCVVFDAATGQRTTVRLGLYPTVDSNYIALVAVHAGSG
jgi:hypothetical protein